MEERKRWWCLMAVLFAVVKCSNGEDPYRFYTWNALMVIYTLLVSNNRNGVQQRRNSWQDGVYGTNCPIPPGQNFTYMLQVKDQIGSYFYFPSLALHKAASGFGGFKINSRSEIPVPFDPPAGDYTVLAGDRYKQNHTDLKAILDGGHDLPFPDGLLINGRGPNGYTFTVNQGICNISSRTRLLSHGYISVNVMIVNIPSKQTVKGFCLEFAGVANILSLDVKLVKIADQMNRLIVECSTSSHLEVIEVSFRVNDNRVQTINMNLRDSDLNII